MDLTWRVPRNRAGLDTIRRAACATAAEYTGVEVEVAQEDADCVTCFFTVPSPEGPAVVEVSVYDLDRDGHVLSLEGEASDNADSWDDAAELAENLAERLDAEPLDL